MWPGVDQREPGEDFGEPVHGRTSVSGTAPLGGRKISKLTSIDRNGQQRVITRWSNRRGSEWDGKGRSGLILDGVDLCGYERTRMERSGLILRGVDRCG